MTERFRVAANALLSRRLNNLIRIDNNLEIDLRFITCAEYQLFIDDIYQEGKYRQPEHWVLERFPPGDAQKPITGVRASDAEEFCDWLTQKESIPGFSYRLPSLAEIRTSLATIEHIGCWCKDGNTFKISGITFQKWQTWQTKLAEYFIFKSDFLLNRDLYYFLKGDFYLDLYDFLYRDLFNFFYHDLKDDLDYLKGDLKQLLKRDIKDNIYCPIERDLYDELKTVLRSFLYSDLKTVLRSFLYSGINRILNFDLYNDLNRVLKLDFDFDLNLDLEQKIDLDKISNLLLLYFPLIFMVVIYHILHTIYRKATQNHQIGQSINLTRREMEQISHKYAQNRDKIYPLYIYLVLIDERQKGNMPAWEGIRIVREREEID